MIRLDNPNTQLLSLITAQNGANVVVSYSDKTAAAYTGATQVTNITSATTTTICATPAASTIRDVDHITVKNTFAGSHTVTLQFSSGATLYPIATVALANGDLLEYTHASGLRTIDASGNIKTVYTTSQLIIAAGKTLTVSNSLTLAGTDGTTMTFPATSGTVATLNTTNSFSVVQSFAAGSVAAPSIYLSTDTGTGFYRIGANNYGYAVSGVKVLDFTSIGISVTGKVFITGGDNPYLALTDTTGTGYIQVVSGDIDLTPRAGKIVKSSADFSVTGPISATTTGKVGTTLGVGNATPAASGAGITFPATQSASSDANTLDDYEEGTWEGTLGGSTGNPTTPVTATGEYTKIGRFVVVHIRFDNVDTTGASGNVRITGLPFTSGFSSNGSCYMAGFGSAVAVSAIAASATQMIFVDAVTAANIAHSAPGAGKYINATLSYLV